MHSLKETYKTPYEGIVTIGYRNKETGVFSPVLHKKNLVMYGAADAMAQLLAGDNRYAVSHMYYHYQNTAGSTTAPTVGREDGIQSFLDINSDYISTEDWLRIPIFSAAKIDSYASAGEDASVYNGNMATFVATSAAHPTQKGESVAENAFSNASNSKIVSVALACAPSPADKTKDVVFSRLVLSSPIVVQANSYVDCFWSIAFK